MGPWTLGPTQEAPGGVPAPPHPGSSGVWTWAWRIRPGTEEQRPKRPWGSQATKAPWGSGLLSTGAKVAPVRSRRVCHSPGCGQARWLPGSCGKKTGSYNASLTRLVNQGAPVWAEGARLASAPAPPSPIAAPRPRRPSAPPSLATSPGWRRSQRSLFSPGDPRAAEPQCRGNRKIHRGAAAAFPGVSCPDRGREDREGTISERERGARMSV